jgi:hypothetical protein
MRDELADSMQKESLSGMKDNNAQIENDPIQIEYDEIPPNSLSVFSSPLERCSSSRG